MGRERSRHEGRVDIWKGEAGDALNARTFSLLFYPLLRVKYKHGHVICAQKTLDCMA